MWPFRTGDKGLKAGQRRPLLRSRPLVWSALAGATAVLLAQPVAAAVVPQPVQKRPLVLKLQGSSDKLARAGEQASQIKRPIIKIDPKKSGNLAQGSRSNQSGRSSGGGTSAVDKGTSKPKLKLPDLSVPRPKPDPHRLAKPGKTDKLEQPDKPGPIGGQGRTPEPGSTDKPPPRDPVAACAGGRLVGGKCVCPGGESPRRLGTASFVCVTGPGDIARPGNGPDCRRGTMVAGKCICPVGLVAKDGRCVPGVAMPPAIVPLPPILLPPALAGGGLPRLPAMPPASPGRPPVLPPALQELSTFTPDEVLVSLAPGTPPGLAQQVAAAHAMTIIEETELPLLQIRLVRYRIPDGRTVPGMLAALRADGSISAAQENFYYRQNGSPAGAPRAAAEGLQYALAKVEAAVAHSVARGRGTLVAVIDSGVDRNHPDLAASVVEELDLSGDDKGARNDDPHGTAIAGIIAARGTLTGVAPESRILSARAFRADTAGRPASATSYGIARGLDWAISKGARVLNLSFAGPRDPLLEQAVKAVTARRAIVVAAAGNGGPAAPPAYPAAYAEVIAVTATDAEDRLYERANRGGYIAVAAPGVEIIVAGLGRGHRFESGTSFAAAHVSAIVALMLEVAPELTPEAARRALIEGAVDLGRPRHDIEFGAGRISAAAAVRAVGARK